MTIKASMVSIQEATPEGIAHIASLNLERIKGRSSDDDTASTTFTVELEGTFIGYLIVSQNTPETIEIEEFALLEEYRGKGYGRLAVKALFETMCANAQHASFYIRCLSSEEPMIRLSTTEGFFIIGSDEKFFHLCKPCDEHSSESIDFHKNILSDNGGTLYRDNQEAVKALVLSLQN